MQKQTKGNYPAPPAILECARAGIEGGHTVGSKKERELFGMLAGTWIHFSLDVYPIRLVYPLFVCICLLSHA